MDGKRGLKKAKLVWSGVRNTGACGSSSRVSRQTKHGLIFPKGKSLVPDPNLAELVKEVLRLGLAAVGRFFNRRSKLKKIQETKSSLDNNDDDDE